MSAIIVCPLADLDATIAETAPERVLSLQSPPLAPPVLNVPAHVSLSFHDIVDETWPSPDHVHPSIAHAERIVGFAEAWNEDAPCVVHCRYGVSRSPAAALIVMAVRRPTADETRLARMLRSAAPFATPNRRLIAHADAALGRSGRLFAAVEAIGRGTPVSTGRTFRMVLP